VIISLLRRLYDGHYCSAGAACWWPHFRPWKFEMACWRTATAARLLSRAGTCVGVKLIRMLEWESTLHCNPSTVRCLTLP
jgi:hypothetical protein